MAMTETPFIVILTGGALPGQDTADPHPNDIAVVLDRAAARDAPVVTKTGRVLTGTDIAALAGEAERGYDPEFRPRQLADQPAAAPVAAALAKVTRVQDVPQDGLPPLSYMRAELVAAEGFKHGYYHGARDHRVVAVYAASGQAAATRFAALLTRDVDPAYVRRASTPKPKAAGHLMRIADPSLVVLIGAAGSGKSTLAGMLWPGQTLSSDQLRDVIAGDPGDQTATDEAFRVLHTLLAARLTRKLTTVVDATNATRDARSTLLGIARQFGVPAVAVVSHPPLSVVLARNAERDRPVPEETVRRQHRQVTDALGGLTGEGFGRVILAPAAGWTT